MLVSCIVCSTPRGCLMKSMSTTWPSLVQNVGMFSLIHRPDDLYA